MVAWTLSIKPRAERDISSLDRRIARQVLEKLSWLERNFDSIVPRGLSANLVDSYKLRVGDYRVVYELSKSRRIIHVYRVEHRSKVYKK